MRSIFITLTFLLALTTAQAEEWPKGKNSDWKGYPRLDFKLPDEGANCIVVTPKRPLKAIPGSGEPGSGVTNQPST